MGRPLSAVEEAQRLQALIERDERLQDEREREDRLGEYGPARREPELEEADAEERHRGGG